MKFIKAILVFFLAFIIFTACKKEGPAGPEGPTGPTGSTTAVNPAIYGKWQVLSGMPGTKYYILKNDNSLFRLDSADHGFKSMQSTMAMLTYTQINAFSTIFNYSISNDTLNLTNFNNNIVLKRNNNAPEESAWMTYVTVTDSIDSPSGGDGREDIAFDGTNILWTSESSSSTLYKINPATHVVVNFPLANSYYYGSTTFATFLWISDNSMIEKVDPATGAFISTSPSLGTSRIIANALVGSSDMWYCEGSNVKTWNIVSDVITPQFNLYMDGMEYTGGFLYIFSGHNVYKCQLSPTFEAITTYYVDYPNVSGNNGGITFDGSHFWVVGYNYNSGEYKLYKLSI